MRAAQQRPTVLAAAWFAWLAPALAACASGRHTTAPPPLAGAPPALHRLALSIQPEPRVSGYWARKRLGRALVRALSLELEAALARAGFRTGHAPDLVLRLSADLAGSTNHLVSATTLELVQGGRVVDRIEIRSPEDISSLRAETYPEHVAIALSNALSRSAALAAFASETSPENRDTNKALILAAFDVFDSSNQLDPTSKDQLSEYVAVRMTQSLGYRVVPRAQIHERLLDDKEQSYRACVDQACQIELGKALAAQKSLATTLIRVGATCALTATLFDLKTETAELAASVKTECSKDSLLAGVDGLIAELRNQAL